MFKRILLPSTLILILMTQLFINSLLPPINFINVINIFLMQFFFFGNLEKVILISLILAILKDFNENSTLGASAIIYIPALIIIYILHNTVFTHHKLASIFVLGLMFNLMYSLGFMLIKLKINLLIFQESILIAFTNTALSFLTYIAIKIVQNQWQKKFI